MMQSKISILVVLVLSTFYNSETRGITQTSQSDDSTDSQNCFCLGHSGKQTVKVPDLIQTSKGIERLVIYLYKDLDGDEIKMYTPSLEKQMLIPDFQLENGDGWTTVSTETVSTILSRSADKTFTRVMGEVSNEDNDINIDVASHNSDRTIFSDEDIDLNEEDAKEDGTIIYTTNDPNKDDIMPNVSLEKDQFSSHTPQIKFIEYDTVGQIDGQKYTGETPSYSQVKFPQKVTPKQHTDGQYNDWILHELEHINDTHNVEEDANNFAIEIGEKQFPDSSNMVLPQVNISDKTSHDHDFQEYQNIHFVPKLEKNIPPTINTYGDIISQQQNKNHNMQAITQINIPRKIPNFYTVHGKTYSNGNPVYAHVNIPDVQNISSSQQRHIKLNKWIIDQLQRIIKERNTQYLRNQIDTNQHSDVLSAYEQINLPRLDLQPDKFDDWSSEQSKGELNFRSPHDIDLRNQIDVQQFKHDNSQYTEKNIPNAVPFVPQGQFNEWILEQLEAFKNLESDGPEQIDLSFIGNSILKVLLTNGMFVLNNGMVVDSHGKLIDIHNLSLRPIMIGNTLPLKKLLNQQHELLDSQIPYIQAVLVTATHPLKVLGLIPLGKTYLPLSIHNNAANSWKTKPDDIDITNKPSNFEVEKSINKVLDNAKDETSNHKRNESMPEKISQIKLRQKLSKHHKNEGKEESYIPKPSNYYKMYGNENKIDKPASKQTRNMFSVRRGLRSGTGEYSSDELYSNSLNALNLDQLQQDGGDSNVGRLFLPRLSLFDEPLHISSTRRNQKIPLEIVVKRRSDPAVVKVPSLITDIVDVAFRSDSPTENYVVGKRNGGSRPFMRTRSVPISGNVERNRNPITTLKGLSIVNMSRQNQIPSHLGHKHELNRMLGHPFRHTDLDESESVSQYNRPMILGTGQLSSGTLNSPEVNEVPMSIQELPENDIIPYDIEKYRTFYQNNPSLMSHTQQLDKLSRSGIMPDGFVPYNSANSEQLGLLVDNGDDDDDDDGDFRIIGGNAATGSGTPLSNKGRSGYVF